MEKRNPNRFVTRFVQVDSLSYLVLEFYDDKSFVIGRRYANYDEAIRDNLCPFIENAWSKPQHVGWISIDVIKEYLSQWGHKNLQNVETLKFECDDGRAFKEVYTLDQVIKWARKYYDVYTYVV